MEPSDLYNRSKRTLAIFAALLLLVLLGGIKPEDHGNALGFKISDPALIPSAVFCMLVYSLYQYMFAWSLQTDELRSRVRYDFLVTAGVALAVIGAFFVFYAAPLLINLGFRLVLLAGVLIAAAVLGHVLYKNTELWRWKSEALSLRKSTVRDRLLQPGWHLNFNAKHPNGSKSLEFLEDGGIGEGRNDNEHTWTLEGQILAIRRSNDTLQNRFRYDEATDRFISTDDAEADAVKRGYKGQYIFRLPVK